MAKIISILNNKGGTGKTTTSLNLCAALADMDYKVLALDFDSQCNLSISLGVLNPEKHIGQILLRQNNIDEVIIDSNKVHIIPASDKLLDFELLINTEPGRDYIMKENLSLISNDYDYIIIDCPPSLGILSINSLVAADYFLVPMETENFAFIGLDSILHMVDKVKNRMNPNLDLAGILLIKYDKRIKFGQAVVTNIKSNDRLNNKIFDTKIRKDIALMESTAFNQSIFDYAPKSRGAVDYRNFADELITKIESDSMLKSNQSF